MFEWIFICGIFFAFYNAWGIGANDCANSFATSVGSGVLTLKKAVIIASIFEFLGAVLMGSHVTDMVRKKIVEIDIFKSNPGALMFGMLCADLSSAIWLTVATYFKLPVSTTHSIIGAIVGFSLAFGGSDAVNWNKIGLVVASWIASPFIAGIFSLCTFYLLNRFCFQKKDSFRRITFLFPGITFFTFFINSLFIIYKGSPQLELDELPFWQCFVISSGISIVTAIISKYVYLPYAIRKIKKNNENNNDSNLESQNDSNIESQNDSNIESQNTIILRELEDNESVVDESSLVRRTKSYLESNIGDNGNNLNIEEFKNSNENSEENSNENSKENSEELYNNFEYDKSKNINDNILRSRKYVKKLEELKKQKEIETHHKNADLIDKDSEQLCHWIQIITACFSSFAHGSNDVANAIAPLATIYHIYRYNEITKKADIPIWILVLGGLGIVIGLATWGYKIIDRIGKEITKISASRGFIIELSAALTVIIASRSEIPVSTTHCQVGSIVGCGLVGGNKNIKWSLLKNIVMSWVITLPVTGLLSAGLFSYGYYSPNELNQI